MTDEQTGARLLMTANDLVAKLEFDFGRMRNDAFNRYAAFDFFVTAEHMGDWCEGRPFAHSEKPSQNHGGDEWLQLACDIASRNKHFGLQRNGAGQVANVEERNGGFSLGFDALGFDTGGLVIERPQEEPIEALSLAERVLTFWQQQLRSGAVASR